MGLPLLSWVQFDREDLKKTRDFIHLLETTGSVDELGFGVGRNYFSEILFPVASTQMSHRARYFIFVPYLIAQASLDDRPSYKLVSLQQKLRQQLKSVETRGIIGMRKEELARYPADIYWAACKELKIAKVKGNVEGLLKRLHSGSAGEGKDEEGVSQGLERVRTQFLPGNPTAFLYRQAFRDFEKTFELNRDPGVISGTMTVRE